MKIPTTSLLLALGCASAAALRTGDAAPAAQRQRWAAPAIERAVSVRDGRTREALSWDALFDRLERADAVFLGETHVDETTHRFELAAYEELLARRGGKVVLALEMFERDVQADLDAYVRGESDEATFLAASRPWTNYRTAYRPLIERARAGGLPVVASNFPTPLRRRVAMGGPEALAALEGEERAQVPEELLANTPAYWRRVDNAIRGHLGMMGGPADPDDPRLTSTQSLWDNSMGEACALALDAHPGHQVLHVNGGFHSEYWDGTVRQLRLRKPEAEVLTVAILPSMNPAIEDLAGAPVADFEVFVELRARDLNEGSWAVHVPRALRYLLHVPPAARDDAPVPLLIWLGDEGLTPADGLALWRGRLGEACAILALEAPYREIADDLVEGGRWFFPDTFRDDVDLVREAVERAWGYVARNYPVDPRRVALAGEGTGATLVAAVSLLSERLEADAVAIEPRRYSKIKDFPLPLPELRGDDPAPDKSLRLLLGARDLDWWQGELEQYAGIGFESGYEPVVDDPWSAEGQREDALRRALGLAPRERPEAHGVPRHVVARGPRARHWARLAALRHAAREGVPVAVVAEEPATDASQTLSLEVAAADFEDGAGLPRCPGPFGGTTVLALLPGTPASEADAWRALGERDPLNAISRFHRLRVADADGANDLRAVLGRLIEEGRTNVLVVPATFCADGAALRALRQPVLDLEDRMTLTWSPGLGAQGAD